jgi:hypothetical protein
MVARVGVGFVPAGRDELRLIPFSFRDRSCGFLTDERELIPTGPLPNLSGVPKERFYAFLHLAHHRGART